MTEPSPSRALPRIKLVALALVFLAPLVIATLWWANVERWGAPPDRVNHGELITPPLTIERAALRRPDGQALAADFLRRRWTLLYISGPDCGDLCRAQLHAMRQVHTALGEDRLRVQRLHVVVGDTAVPARTEGRGNLTVASAAPDTAWLQNLARVIGGAPAGSRRIYVVDPLGNLMLGFPAGRDPKGLLEDLERLLKLSRIG